MVKNFNKHINHNIKLHDKIATEYDAIHTEIYNITEQERIKNELKYSIDLIKNTNIDALDFGAGTGNLTKYLLEFGLNVTASDVSIMSLNLLKQKFSEKSKLVIKEINGDDLDCFKSNSFDLVVTYSVLHHVPDYLKAVKEMVRVLKPGGVIYIDHELCPSYWVENVIYNSYISEIQKYNSPKFFTKLNLKLKKLFIFSSWIKLYNRIILGLNEEGDIHTKKNDHIEWNEIENIVSKNCTILKLEDYLVCRELSFQKPIYEKFKNTCSDMRILIAKKNII